MNAAIRLENVTVRYRRPRERIWTLKEYAIRKLKRRIFFDDFLALNDFDLEIAPGETVGIIGRNGAGKTTTMKTIVGVLRATAGEVTAGFSKEQILKPPKEDPSAPDGVFSRVRGLLLELA